MEAASEVAFLGNMATLVRQQLSFGTTLARNYFWPL